MSKNESPFEIPIQIDYQPPSWLLTALTFAYAGAIICLFSVAVSAWIKCIALFLCYGDILKTSNSVAMQNIHKNRFNYSSMRKMNGTYRIQMVKVKL